ncbi:MAG: hypothetical protein OXT69_11960 [Candidatus Poribacteria bacterium]|nr:hypothetical protein [Candidatus Poribacteria bacterium]
MKRLCACAVLWTAALSAGAFALIQNGAPVASISVGPDASALEQSGSYALQSFFFRATEQTVIPETADSSEARRGMIAVGTPETHPLIARLVKEGRLSLTNGDGLGEGYLLRVMNENGEEWIAAAGETPRGAFYAAGRLIELALERALGVSPVDQDFPIPRIDNLEIDLDEERSVPFYPIRMTLEKESPGWLGKMRVNMSGAEGVWTGTGIDDGIGAAVQYVLGFERYQDKPRAQREAEILSLRRRFWEMKRRGVEPFLFMYLTGEPTKALIRARPDMLGPSVPYPASRNGVDYRPFCWSNPDTLAFFAELSREIALTYPNLTGFHLRAWGRETRACECDECGGSGERAQELLWDVLETVIDAARSVRPEMRFLVSGYNRSWLKDPDGKQLRRLPAGTVLLQKWGADGEPTADPGIDPELLHRVDAAGHRLAVLSHDVEETQPLWMLEAELFARGVLLYAENPTLRGLGGFTLQGQTGALRLDKRLSARMNWQPSLEALTLIDNILAVRYGREAGANLAEALRENARALSDFFLDYAGILTATGGYRRGSKWFATRMWDLFGERALTDILNLPDAEAADYALRRLGELRALQDPAAQAARRAALTAAQTDAQLEDAVQLMEAWSAYFACREALAQAARVGFQPKTDEPLLLKRMAEAERQLERTRALLDAVQLYTPLIHISAEGSKRELLSRIEAEQAYLEQFDARTLIRPMDAGKEPSLGAFELTDALMAPSPVQAGGAALLFRLGAGADSVVADIYAASGRRVARLEGGQFPAGRAELFWDGRGSDGSLLANGAYYFRLTARLNGDIRQAVGKFAVAR